MKKRFVLAVIAMLYVFAFGVLFGSNRGVFGDLVNGLDFALKTKIINSLAIFGYCCIGVGVWFFVVGKQAASTSTIAATMFFALWLSLAWGFLSVDCAIFNFCSSSREGTRPACAATYYKQGAHADCE